MCSYANLKKRKCVIYAGAVHRITFYYNFNRLRFFIWELKKSLNISDFE